MGFLEVDVPPSPNVQFQVVGELLETSVNVTVAGAVPLVGVPLKSATGGATVVPRFTVYALMQAFALAMIVVRSVQLVPVLLA